MCKSDFPGAGLLINGPFHADPVSPFEQFLAPTVEEVIKFEPLFFNAFPLVSQWCVALGGLTLGWLVYGRKPLAAGQPDPLAARLGGLWFVLKNKYFIDEIYNVTFVQPGAAHLGMDGRCVRRAGHRWRAAWHRPRYGRAGECLPRISIRPW